MKKSIDLRILGALAALLIGIGLSYIPSHQRLATAISKNSPAQVCPALSSAGSTTAYLPTTHLKIRPIDAKSTSFTITPQSVIPTNSYPILVDSNSGRSISISNLSGSGIAAVPCSPGSPDEWFIGGSGGVTSKGILYLANSGLSESTIDIYAFTSKAQLPIHSIKVKANSEAAVSLDALAPGEDAMALHVVTRTGRISAFVLDQRAKGLSGLGMDYVKPSESADKELYIPGLYPHNGDKSRVATSLRILVPGSLDATIHVEAISADGTFIPVGFDGVLVPHNQVVTLPLKNLTTSGPFGLHIQSDQPVLVGALTTVGSGDFAWASPVGQLSQTVLNFGGSAPKIIALGSDIRVTLSGRYSTGKSFRQTLSGNGIALWSAKIGVNNLSFSIPAGQRAYLGAIINSGGLTYLPINSGVSIENTALPFNDVHTLTH
jgi:Family of unknown function (DUF5719)